MTSRPLPALSVCLAAFFVTGCSDDPTIIGSPRDAKDESSRSDLPREDGEYIFDDGSTYNGELVDEKPDGFGQRKFVSGDIYKGDFRKGRQSGEGVMIYRSDASLNRYDGAWATDKHHGTGTLVYADNSTRTGLWRNGFFLRGTWQTADGTVKQGIWDGDDFVRGFAKFPDDSSFTGSWANNDFHEGTLTTAEGNYTGSFLQGKHHGFGILEQENGETYVGQFQDGLYHGTGHVEYPDGKIYAGRFFVGKRHGKGRQKDPSGVEYVGDWNNGEREGKGTLDFGDGTRFEGDFLNGLAVDGQFIMPDGSSTRSYQDENGKWKDR